MKYILWLMLAVLGLMVGCATLRQGSVVTDPSSAKLMQCNGGALPDCYQPVDTQGQPLSEDGKPVLVCSCQGGETPTAPSTFTFICKVEKGCEVEGHPRKVEKGREVQVNVSHKGNRWRPYDTGRSYLCEGDPCIGEENKQK